MGPWCLMTVGSMEACSRSGLLSVAGLLVSTLGSITGCGLVLGLDDFTDAEQVAVGTGGGATTGSGETTGGGAASDHEAPTVPVVRLPLNDAYIGTMRKQGSRRPRFVWEASKTTLDTPVEYELQLGADPDMIGAISVVTDRSEYIPDSDLEGSLLPPVGRRYYWRVRACAHERCSEFSPVRWFNVGRTRCDFNADGYDDVAVGAAGPTTSAGAIYFYYGAADAPFGAQSNGVVFSPDGAGDGFGAAVACAGDVDGDGYADVLVGAPSGEASKAIIYRGSGQDSFRGEILATLAGAGNHVSHAGDVNADGFGDVIVERAGEPAAYLYFGGASGIENLSNPVVLDVDVGAGVRPSGVLVSSAGDVNGDGFSDIILAVAARGLRVVRVYFGNPGQGFDRGPDVELEVPPEDPDFFSSIAAAGDVNGDGFGDVIIGSSVANRAYLYFGGPQGIATTPDVTLVGVGRAKFGISVASAGDMNGDGFEEVAVGASDYASSPGAVYVYKGGAAGEFDDMPDVAMYRPGDTPVDFGSVLGSSGDVNGDGYADLMVGAPSADTVYVYWGKPDLVTPAEVDAAMSQPHEPGRSFGVAVTRR